MVLPIIFLRTRLRQYKFMSSLVFVYRYKGNRCYSTLLHAKIFENQLFPPVVSKLANLSNDNTHHSYFLLFSSCLRIFCVYYNQLGLQKFQ